MDEPPSEDVAVTTGKSVPLAVSLALLFGPIGLLYVRAWGTVFIGMFISGLALLTGIRSLWLAVGIRLVSAALAYSFAINMDEGPNTDRDSAILLEEAARLESTDRAKAIEAYQRLIEKYPNTAASREAARNIQVLTKG